MRELLQRAKQLRDRADRLMRLVELNAPDLVIEGARQLVGRSFISFPAKLEFIEQNEKINNDITASQDAHLSKTGYYKDIEAELKDCGEES